MQHRNQTLRNAGRLLCASAIGIVGCGDEAPLNGSQAQALAAECVAPDAALPAGAWECSEPFAVECADGSGTADVETVYVRGADADACGDDGVTVSNAGPFAVGIHDIVVTDSDDAVLCQTQLTVTDTQAPTLEGKTLNIWPPNHKFHTITVADCVSVSDACQNDLVAEFIWASSDEPVDGRGDGHHAPDILIDDCNQVQVRAERMGPKDGRVYKLGVRVVDGAGNATESECAIIVDHDQRGVVGADSGESYRIDLNGQNGTIACDGEGEPPVAPPAPPGDNGGDPGDNGGAPDPTPEPEPEPGPELI